MHLKMIFWRKFMFIIVNYFEETRNICYIYLIEFMVIKVRIVGGSRF